MPTLRLTDNGVTVVRGSRDWVMERADGQWGSSVTPAELMARLSGLRRAQIGGRRAPHKPLLPLWLFGQFAATASARATYAEAASPVSQLINDFGPPVKSPALERQRAAMPFVHLERDLWDLRDRHGRQITADVRCTMPSSTAASSASAQACRSRSRACTSRLARQAAPSTRSLSCRGGHGARNAAE